MSQAFDNRLAFDKEWGLSEGSLFLDGRGAVHETLRRVCKRLDEAGIPYAIAGGMALFERGFQRFTKDVDILVTRDGLHRIHEQLEGRGYVRPFRGSKNLRDAQTGVRIEFLVTGQYPGDGKPKPVAFPDPEQVSDVCRGIRVLNLETLIELKLASGMTNPERMKDLVDVQELIKAISLSKDFFVRLNAYVRGKYCELWDSLHAVPKRFIREWRRSPETTGQLAAMQAEGVTIEPGRGPTPDDVRLVTSDSDIARKYDMHDESEFWDEQHE